MQLPTRAEEEDLFAQGYQRVAGLDEAGRGPLAGPVVAAAVVLPQHLPHESRLGLLRDSKMLSEAQREAALPYIQMAARHIGVGMASPAEIDVCGIVPATRRAMERALAELPERPDYLLVDALKLHWRRIPCKPIVHGDALCLCIAAASIVAKVTRDRLMVAQDTLFPGYGFARHKGYGTPQHLQAIRRLGPSHIHRHSFAPIRDRLEMSSDGAAGA